MQTLQIPIETLTSGDRLSREEFLRRWEALPHIKHAELIGGKVYIMSPSSHFHGSVQSLLILAASYYGAKTPGCAATSETTSFMGPDVTQPDACLRILPEFGGSSRVGSDGYIHGSPEFIAEAAYSSAAYDLYEKKQVYSAVGVQEYVVALIREKSVRCFRLAGQDYEEVSVPADGIIRSQVFPGLWLNAVALAACDAAQMLQTLEQGVGSTEHATFAASLIAKKS